MSPASLRALVARLARAPRDPGWRPLRPRSTGRRRLAAAALAAIGVACAVRALAPAPAATVAALAAAHDLPAGDALAAGDVVVVHRPVGTLPRDALPASTALAGRRVAGGVRAGEVLTDVRLAGPGLVRAIGSANAAAPVRIADAQAAALVSPGDRVDVLVATGSDAGGAADSTPAGARTVVRDATVLAGPPTVADDGSGWSAAGAATAGDAATGGALLVLGVSDDEATDLAAAQRAGPLLLVLH